ncbi:MAG: hypothetical protein AB1806_00370 [Acidobacteriota bacterium]
MIGLVARVPAEVGAPSAERPDPIARLRDELATLEAAEEQAVDNAISAGVIVAHRPAVVQRRENEKRRRELDEQAVARRAERQRALDAQFGNQAPRAMASQYIASNGKL